MCPLRVVIVVVWEVDPLWWVGGCAVHKALQGPFSSWRLLRGAVHAFPLQDRNPHLGALVRVWAAFKLVKKVQHLLVHTIDLPDHAVAMSRKVQQMWNVMFSSNH